MSAEHISTRRVLYPIPDVDAIEVRRDVEYRITDAGSLTMDLYYPPGARDAARPLPAVVIVAGYPSPGVELALGRPIKELAFITSWAELLAASGMVAIIYENREPAADADALLEYIRANATSLGIDAARIGLWATSGNAPLSLFMLMQERPPVCAALVCGLTLDLDGFTSVADAAATWKFVNPAAGKSVADLPADVPLFLARAGRDEVPHLNETMDRFVAHALARNLPVTLVNHPEAPHAFDIFHDSALTREIIRQLVKLLRFHLVPPA
jgi:hypothetical protein